LANEAVMREADKLQQVASRAWSKPTRDRKLLDALVRDSAQFRELRAKGTSEADALKQLEADKSFIEAMWKAKTHLQAAFLAQDPGNGHIKAWVGSRDFAEDQFDHVQQARRQPGSTFKPFVYGAAFDMGMGPNELFMDEPVEIRIDAKTTWKPGDVHEVTHEPTTLRDGLVFSKNTITAQLVQRVGAPRVAELARRMGVRQSKLDEVPSLALGTSPVTLKEMVSAYSTIADSGTYVEPVLVLRIENRKGQVLEDFHPRAAEQALPLQASQVLLDVMRGVVDRGTGASIRSRYGLQGDFAGKTGTTQDNTDGWFMLMHPQLVAGAWVGFNDARITMGDSWGQGARNALLVVGNFFQQATKAKAIDTKLRFNAPHDTSQPDPDAIARMQEWWTGVMQASAPQPALVETEAQSRPVLEPPRAVIVAPATENYPPPIAIAPRDFSWTQERQRSTQYQDSAGFAPPPVQMTRPSLANRVPVDGDGVPILPRGPAAELGAGPAPVPVPVPVPAPPAETGVRILRSY
jgi:penicillin-binding protein 1A